MFRFTELDISGIGPFEEGSQLDFKEGMNVISATNGLGKTTIFRALRGEFSNVIPKIVGHRSESIPDWMIYWDDSVDLPQVSKPWAPLANLLATDGFQNVNTAKLAFDISTVLHELLEKKILGVSKFSGTIASATQIEVIIQEHAVLNIVDCLSGADLNWGFQAFGEQMMLFLAANRALRNQLHDITDVPVVADHFMGQMDSMLQQTFLNFIRGLATQIVLLENCNMLGEPNIGRNYESSRNPFSGKTHTLSVT